ncbi:hypothetical protein TcasGA2_TC016015 [Tribolium castaneum]|uniref:Uncharacterized protein n=1 Tax=Tribolium castaneum TaxID=7070 RepID=D2CG14_TRICA|nr:hypothetical protein TcasGA2_TC016015 [Tribolium castaneum]
MVEDKDMISRTFLKTSYTRDEKLVESFFDFRHSRGLFLLRLVQIHIRGFRAGDGSRDRRDICFEIAKSALKDLSPIEKS